MGAVPSATGAATGAVVTEALAAAAGELVAVKAVVATGMVAREGAAAGQAARR
jgi:hypothetical protein